MAQIISKISQSKVIARLDTYNHTALSTSMYVVDVQMTEIPPSGLIITIQKNGVTAVTTSSAPAAAQSILDLRTILNCVPTDLISVILSSANSADTGLNVIKGILNIRTGSV